MHTVVIVANRYFKLNGVSGLGILRFKVTKSKTGWTKLKQKTGKHVLSKRQFMNCMQLVLTHFQLIHHFERMPSQSEFRNRY